MRERGLEERLEDAEAWCDEMGCAEIDEIEEYCDEFVEALGVDPACLKVETAAKSAQSDGKTDATGQTQTSLAAAWLGTSDNHEPLDDW